MRKSQKNYLLLVSLTVNVLLLLFLLGVTKGSIRVIPLPEEEDRGIGRIEPIELNSNVQPSVKNNSPTNSEPSIILDTPDGPVKLINDNGFYTYCALFENIMGMSGYKESRFFGNPLIEPAWRHTTYFAVVPGSKKPLEIAESFSFDIEDDVARDIDGDGVTDLICNCQYGGDGAQRVSIFRKHGSMIEIGQFQLNACLPENAIINHGTAVACDPDTMVTTVKYTLEDTFERVVEHYAYSEGCYLYKKYEP